MSGEANYQRALRQQRGEDDESRIEELETVIRRYAAVVEQQFELIARYERTCERFIAATSRTRN
jgi:hypothetical protein